MAATTSIEVTDAKKAVNSIRTCSTEVLRGVKELRGEARRASVMAISSRDPQPDRTKHFNMVRDAEQIKEVRKLAKKYKLKLIRFRCDFRDPWNRGQVGDSR